MIAALADFFGCLVSGSFLFFACGKSGDFLLYFWEAEGGDIFSFFVFEAKRKYGFSHFSGFLVSVGISLPRLRLRIFEILFQLPVYPHYSDIRPPVLAILNNS
tara:strand:- start:221 stop:529 length:309 start_codon:yes stop_codon:yes gene_type:complete